MLQCAEQNENLGIGFVRISNLGSPVVHWIPPQLFITFDMVGRPTGIKRYRKYVFKGKMPNCKGTKRRK